MKRTGLGLGLGSSKSRKKAWYSTQIFQNTLQQSRLPMRNSRVSWYELWGGTTRTARLVDVTTAPTPLESAFRRRTHSIDGMRGKTYVQVGSQLDEEAFPLEAQLAYFGPVEGVDPRVSLHQEAIRMNY